MPGPAGGDGGHAAGGGPERAEDSIDPGVGISVLAKPGDRVEEGQPLARLAYRDRGRLEAALAVAERAWEIGDAPAEAPPLVAERIHS